MSMVVSIKKKMQTYNERCTRPRTEEFIIVRYADGTSKRFEFDYTPDYIYVYTAVGNTRGEITGYLPVREFKRSIQRCANKPQWCENCSKCKPLSDMRVLIDWRDSLVCATCIENSPQRFVDWVWDNARGAFLHK